MQYYKYSFLLSSFGLNISFGFCLLISSKFFFTFLWVCRTALVKILKLMKIPFSWVVRGVSMGEMKLYF